MMRPTRRQFCRQAAALGVAGLAGSAGWGVLFGAGCKPRTPQGEHPRSDAPPAAAPAAPTPVLETFTPAELAAVTAVCERLLPRDQDPGAIDLGVPRFIDRALAAPELSAHRELLAQILPILDRQARLRFGGKAFHEASPEQQDGLLASWQRGRGGDRRFFEVMLTLTLEGALGDPRHGGNLGGRGYALVGFSPGPVMVKRPAPIAPEPAAAPARDGAPG